MWRLHLQYSTKEHNTWLTANSPAMPFGASSSTVPCLSSWARKLLSIQAWCSMAGCTLPGIGHLSQACQDTKVLVHGSWIRVAKAWIRGGGPSAAAAQSTSLLQLSHQGTIVRERVNCLRGSKSKLTGSVVRLKILPRPLGVSHWVLKSLGCFNAWQCHRGNGRETPINTVGHTFMHMNRHEQLFLPNVRVQCRQSSLLDYIQDTQEAWRRDVGRDGSRGRSGEETGSLRNLENPDVLSQQLAATHWTV